jgi:SAM-dependent methyltransferase
MIKKLRKIFSKEKPQIAKFKAEFKQLLDQEKLSKKRFSLDEENLYPCLSDSTSQTGFDRHYVYHPAWATRIVINNKPSKHIDISSTLHFCSTLSAILPVEFYDYRPAKLELPNLKSLPGDLMNLPFESNSVESISCMHTVEHVGLGRYGDPLDYDADIKAINELKRVLAINGTLLFVVPLGSKDTICFNAHRIYSKDQVLNLFSDLELKEFTLIPEYEADGGLVVNPSKELLEKQFYGCGCFWFTKK